MSTLRFDYSTSDWVIFAPLRSLRPQAMSRGLEASAAAGCCPFCRGNEGLTPREVYAVRNGPGVADWLLRVVPNRFPALQVEEDPQRREDGPLFRSMGGCGAHEVLIESPEHNLHLSQQPVEQIARILEAARLRYIDLMRDQRFQAVVIFKNHGEMAGTSLRHPHLQIIATPVVPPLLRLKHRAASEYFDQRGTPLYLDMIQEEIADGRRMVAVNDEFAAFVPYSAHRPSESWIAPRRKQGSFEQLDAVQRHALAEILKSVLLKLYSGLDDPDFNLTLDVPARGDEGEEYFQWHIRILPRLSTSAGFEMGSGMSINTVLPEDAAAFLRDRMDSGVKGTR